MGVDITAYTVYGVKIEYDSEFCDAYYDNEELEEYVIIDGMGGEYMVLGAQLYVGGDGFETIDISALPERKAEVVAAFKKYMPEYAHLLDGEWQILAFMHYS